MGTAGRIVEWTVAAALLGVFLFATVNASDRSAYQWPSRFLCMFSWMILGPFWVLLFLRRRRDQRRLREVRGFEVKVPNRSDAAGPEEPTPDSAKDRSLDDLA